MLTHARAPSTQTRTCHAGEHDVVELLVVHNLQVRCGLPVVYELVTPHTRNLLSFFGYARAGATDTCPHLELIGILRGQELESESVLLLGRYNGVDGGCLRCTGLVVFRFLCTV